MRSMWSGAITFGLVAVPVKMYLVHDEHGIEFHQVHNADGGRIKMRRFCSVCLEEVEYADLDKGYLHGQQTIQVTKAELEGLALNTIHEISVEQFVRADDVPDIYRSGKAYYLAPEEVGKRAYALLRSTLSSGKGLVGIVRVTMRSRERLAILRAEGDVIILEQLYWHDEVRPAALPVLNDPVRLTTAELKMARQLVNSMTGKFDPHEHQDHYRDAVVELVEAKVAGQVRHPVTPAPRPAPDLAAALAASIVDRRK